MLTQTFKEIFKEAKVVTHKVKHGEFDLIIVPSVQYLQLDKTAESFEDATADIGYALNVFDGRGKKLGVLGYEGEGNSGKSAREDLPRITRAIVQAMESASGAIIAELPQTDLMKPWRAP